MLSNYQGNNYLHKKQSASQAKEFPKDDPEFDADNLKYSCIRYAPIAIENAMGPSWVDPRSGEILNASVYLYHDVIKLLNNWIFIQTAQADKRVRHKIIPREVMDDALRYVVSHHIELLLPHHLPDLPFENEGQVYPTVVFHTDIQDHRINP